MGKRVARNRQATTPEVAEVMRGQGVLGSHGAGTPAPLLWIPKTERISYATTTFEACSGFTRVTACRFA